MKGKIMTTAEKTLLKYITGLALTGWALTFVQQAEIENLKKQLRNERLSHKTLLTGVERMAKKMTSDQLMSVMKDLDDDLAFLSIIRHL